jgi:hypothetical protein
MRRGRVLVVVGHRERKALIARVGCGMARRGRRRLLEDSIFLERVGERVQLEHVRVRPLVRASNGLVSGERGLKMETNVRISTKNPASVENVGGQRRRVVRGGKKEEAGGRSMSGTMTCFVVRVMLTPEARAGKKKI